MIHSIQDATLRELQQVVLEIWFVSHALQFRNALTEMQLRIRTHSWLRAGQWCLLGLKILAVLDVLAGEKQTTEKRRAVRRALFEGNWKNEESLSQFALRREQEFVRLDSLGPQGHPAKGVTVTSRWWFRKGSPKMPERCPPRCRNVPKRWPEFVANFLNEKKISVDLRICVPFQTV